MSSLTLRQPSGMLAPLGDAIDSLVKRQPARAAEDPSLRVITGIH